MAPEDGRAALRHGGRGGAGTDSGRARRRGRHDQHAARAQADRVPAAREGADRGRAGARPLRRAESVVQWGAGGAVR